MRDIITSWDIISDQGQEDGATVFLIRKQWVMAFNLNGYRNTIEVYITSIDKKTFGMELVVLDEDDDKYPYGFDDSEGAARFGNFFLNAIKAERSEILCIHVDGRYIDSRDLVWAVERGTYNMRPLGKQY